MLPLTRYQVQWRAESPHGEIDLRRRLILAVDEEHPLIVLGIDLLFFEVLFLARLAT